jgi:hypothetical protein
MVDRPVVPTTTRRPQSRRPAPPVTQSIDPLSGHDGLGRRSWRDLKGWVSRTAGIWSTYAGEAMLFVGQVALT